MLLQQVPEGGEYLPAVLVRNAEAEKLAESGKNS